LEQRSIQGEELDSVLVQNAELSSALSKASDCSNCSLQIQAATKRRNLPAGVRKRMKQLRRTYLKLTKESEESESGESLYLTANFVQRVFCESDNHELWLAFQENLGDTNTLKFCLGYL
jgi:hypothetical protein